MTTEEMFFLKSIASINEKDLIALHHQISNHSFTIDNYIVKTVAALRKEGDIEEALINLEKVSKMNKKIAATAQFAIRANFEPHFGKELTNIPFFFEQYLENVAKDFVASGLRLKIDNQVLKPFERNVRRIELSILIDNIITNARKAYATSLIVNMNVEMGNRLIISFIDNGKGLDNLIRANDVFKLGVTHANGSGFGLFHSKNIMNSLNGNIRLIRGEQIGVEIKLEFE